MNQASDKAQPAKAAPKRRIRNYLLEPAFQIKYVSMVVVVALLLGLVLGYWAYNFSTEQTQLMQAVALASEVEDTNAVLEFAHEYDRKVLFAIVLGIAILVSVVSATGIVITHRVVGPAFKMRMLLDEVASGNWSPRGRLRKGDELQNLFLSFTKMLEHLKTEQQEEIAELVAAMGHIKTNPDDALQKLQALKARMESRVDAG